MHEKYLRSKTLLENPSLIFSSLSTARSRAEAIRNKSIEFLDKYLIEFESNFIKRGGKIIWAQDNKEALKEIKELVVRSGSGKLFKSNSISCEQAGLVPYLENCDIDVYETRIGDLIQEEFSKGSFHTEFPAFDKTISQIEKKLNLEEGVGAKAVIDELKSRQEEVLSDYQVFLSGANYLIADSGTIVISENEGNVARGIFNSKIHIVVCGIDKVLPALHDVELMISLHSAFSQGDELMALNHFIQGPEVSEDGSSGSELFLILIDNFRSKILVEPDQRKILSCIDCGACSNVCPVFNSIGGYSYGISRNGPIGSLSAMYQGEDQAFNHLSHASTICGKCTEVCPVNIDLHKQFLFSRKKQISEKKSTKAEDLSMYFFKNAVLKRSKMEKGRSKVKNFMLKQFFKKSWGISREFPEICSKSFNQMWRDRFKEFN